MACHILLPYSPCCHINQAMKAHKMEVDIVILVPIKIEQQGNMVCDRYDRLNGLSRVPHELTQTENMHGVKSIMKLDLSQTD